MEKDIKIMILITSILLILFESTYESLSDRGFKLFSGIIEFLYRAILTIVLFSFMVGYHLHFDAKLYYVLGGYLLLRFAIFDIIYNIVRGLPVFFIGTTKIYDKIWQWFFKKTKFPVNHFLFIVKLISLVIGITWLVN